MQNIMSTYFGGYVPVLVSWARCRPLKQINKYKQQTSFTSYRSILNVVGKWGLALLVMLIFHFDLKSRYFYYIPEIEDKTKLNFDGQINTVLFYITNFWYHIHPFSMHTGWPSKERFYKNWICFGLCCWNVLWSTAVFFLKEDFFGGII